MSAGFRAVQWNRAKLVYDAILLAGTAAFIAAFLAIGAALEAPKDKPEWIGLLIRAFGSCAFLMLTIILCIGPLARLDRRFLPLLYNRRHFGVLTFCMAALHAYFMLEWYMAQDLLPTLMPELMKAEDYGKFIGFPFKVLGIAALTVLFLMAATSHDYWLAFLTPPAWKALHMLIYPAYGLVVMHVALGAMQSNRNVLVPVLFGGAFACVALLHLVAGWRESVARLELLAKAGSTSQRRPGCRKSSSRATGLSPDGWIAVGPPASIPDRRAVIVAAPGGERIAVFRDGDEIGALTNLCAHQNGPLGEGRIIDGCVTCPWHGYEYRLADGCAPPPFTEKLATYRVRLRNGIVEVDPRALAPGTPAGMRM
jgi:nitrite reductase/ring-hydroxylating ferredoxin subunit/DMSO/TMAO reductase YedYZ heme-binding membrane subunit